MTPYAVAFLERVTAAFHHRRDAGRATEMAAYMRNQFPYFGIGAAARTVVFRDVEQEIGRPSQQRDLKDVVGEAWRKDEREFQYAAVWLLRRNIGIATPAILAVVRRAITTKPWWDTVDELAVHPVGDLVMRTPALRATMDAWSGSENIWLARSAILYQNRYKTATEVDRLFGYCLRRGQDPEFFIRKAIGWALREYSKTDGAAVERFLREDGSSLSGLSRREAMKWLGASRV